MVLYNRTVVVDNDIKQEWLRWVKQFHIQDMLNTGLFEKGRVFQLVTGNQPEGNTTFTVQLITSSMEHVELFRQRYEQAFEDEQSRKYGEKCLNFTSILEAV